MEYQKILLSNIRLNPLNPRKIYKGRNFDELVNSIKEKGIIQPIVVRPISTMDEGNGVIYEVVAGNRRFVAATKIAFGSRDKKQATIPAVIRVLSEDEAFEFMMIENLQREDLTDLEEAESFGGFIEKKKELGKNGSAIEELGTKTGINPRYIRSRIQVLTLPKYVLNAWNNGRIVYGHLEQFLRVEGGEKLRSFFKWTVGVRDDTEPVVDLKERIDRQSPPLKHATFRRDECRICPRNSAVQIKLWDLGDEKALLCHDPKCFRKKQAKNLKENWEMTEFCKKFKTLGFRFKEDLDWNTYRVFRGYTGSFRPDDECKKCDTFVTILTLMGKVDEAKACVKTPCFEKKEKAWSRRGDPEKKKVDSSGPRVSWHGEHFREEFLSSTLPKRYELFGHADIKMAHMSLFAFVKLDNELLSFMAKEIKLKDHYLDKKLFERIGKMDRDEVQELLQKCALKVIMKRQWPVSCEGRLAAATHLGINLKKEFAITQEYLEKKTIKEMLEFGKKYKLFAEPKMMVYLVDKIKKKEFEKCKKAELIEVFLKSGVDLVGKVPAEILPARRKT